MGQPQQVVEVDANEMARVRRSLQLVRQALGFVD